MAAASTGRPTIGVRRSRKRQSQRGAAIDCKIDNDASGSRFGVQLTEPALNVALLSIGATALQSWSIPARPVERIGVDEDQSSTKGRGALDEEYGL